jgi:CheY-like chemotaxis protein/HPt (histidine-containing phosphotransfer) domain-containing protein
MAKSFLLNAHLRVTEAEHGQQALERASEQTFDLILMDMQMPVLDGLAATTQLRAQGLRTPIIALTASAIRGEKERCLAAGMDDYLAKPFYEEELLQLLCRWLPSPLSPAPAASHGHGTETAPSAPPEPKLYNLNVLVAMARGDQNFVSAMLETFLKSTKQAMQDIQNALAIGDVKSIQNAAHKLRPSLQHLQIYPTLAVMDRLENWEKPFSHDEVRPLIESASRELTQVLAAIGAELETRRAKKI